MGAVQGHVCGCHPVCQASSHDGYFEACRCHHCWLQGSVLAFAKPKVSQRLFTASLVMGSQRMALRQKQIFVASTRDGKANAASSSSSSSGSSSSSSYRSKRRKLELQTALTHLKSLEEVHHLEDMGGCLHITKSAMKNINAALHMYRACRVRMKGFMQSVCSAFVRIYIYIHGRVLWYYILSIASQGAPKSTRAHIYVHIHIYTYYYHIYDSKQCN